MFIMYIHVSQFSICSCHIIRIFYVCLSFRFITLFSILYVALDFHFIFDFFSLLLIFLLFFVSIFSFILLLLLQLLLSLSNGYLFRLKQCKRTLIHIAPFSLSPFYVPQKKKISKTRKQRQGSLIWMYVVVSCWLLLFLLSWLLLVRFIYVYLKYIKSNRKQSSILPINNGSRQHLGGNISKLIMCIYYVFNENEHYCEKLERRKVFEPNQTKPNETKSQ